MTARPQLPEGVRQAIEHDKASLAKVLKDEPDFQLASFDLDKLMQ